MYYIRESLQQQNQDKTLCIKKGGIFMIQFNVEEFRADFAKALATRPEVEKIVETVEKRGYDNLVFIGVGGTEIEWRSVLDTLRG